MLIKTLNDTIFLPDIDIVKLVHLIFIRVNIYFTDDPANFIMRSLFSADTMFYSSTCNAKVW